LLTSNVYRMSTVHPRAGQAALIDPENRLHWRFERQRLDAEAIRDSILAVSETLDLSMAGKTLPLRNRQMVFNHTSKDHTTYGDRRRSAYLPVVRNHVADVLAQFDYPDPRCRRAAGIPPWSLRNASSFSNSPLLLDAGDAMASASRAAWVRGRSNESIGSIAAPCPVSPPMRNESKPCGGWASLRIRRAGSALSGRHGEQRICLLAMMERRHLLKTSAIGFGHLALSAMLGNEAIAASRAHFTPRAKRVIFLFMKGGPSHVDTFDPKPLLDRDHGKAPPFELPRVTFAKQGNLLKSPWKFHRHGERSAGQRTFSEGRSRADDLCVLRSVHGTNPAHGGALLKLSTGSDSQVRPSLGSWVVYGLGNENENLPAFLTICPTLAHGGVNNWGSAFLPAYCQGTPLGTASTPASEVAVRHIANPRIATPLQRKQLDLIQGMNRHHLETTGPDQALEGRIAAYELAYRMQSVMPEAQSIENETPATKRLYGIGDPVTEKLLAGNVSWRVVSWSAAFVSSK